ncbi:YciI family protein [Promicromonospora soli]|uniref:Transcription initiation protein n=1 Tax=Promicromonospora soli TaxID=2035533 RepID=A0A919KX85_9MICO|nr:YciI family protein [Promicromonospora soli]GHH75898.1 transcription initiation protein [Promicromonospora soli]
MRYLMLVIEPDVPDRGPTPETETWVAEQDASGARVLGSRLRPGADVRRVTLREGEIVVTDGPFSESKEVISGFDIIEAASPEEALAIAAASPGARNATVEVHPFWPTEP